VAGVVGTAFSVLVATDVGMLGMVVIGCVGAAVAIVAQRNL
jgi:hypothetical protein